MLLIKWPLAIKSIFFGCLTVLFWFNFVIQDSHYQRFNGITSFFPAIKLETFVTCPTLVKVLERLGNSCIPTTSDDGNEPTLECRPAYLAADDRVNLIAILNRYSICQLEYAPDPTIRNPLISETAKLGIHPYKNFTQTIEAPQPKVSPASTTTRSFDSYFSVVATLSEPQISQVSTTLTSRIGSFVSLEECCKNGSTPSPAKLGGHDDPGANSKRGNLDSKPLFTIAQRGPYRIIMDLFPARPSGASVRADAVTIATQCSPSYLYHLKALARRWVGPISVAVYCACADQVADVVGMISDMRDCDKAVMRHVSFHIFYYSPQNSKYNYSAPDLDFTKIGGLIHLNRSSNVLERGGTTNDSNPECVAKLKALKGYKDTLQWNPGLNFGIKTNQTRSSCNGSNHRLDPVSKLYPVNTGRNVARLAAKTAYVFTLDVEFVPNRGLMKSFLNFVRTLSSAEQLINRPSYPATSPKVFVVPAFEVKGGIDRPRDKAELLVLIANGSAVPFHRRRCHPCHIIPNYNKFIRSGPGGTESEGLGILAITRWIPPFWEPIFISSNQDPLYDERFLGYGRNKIQMCYELCRAGYLFYVLDGAFVTHQGISILTNREKRAKASIMKKNNVLFEKFKREINERYGGRNDPSCEFRFPARGKRKQALVSSGKAKSQAVQLVNKQLAIDRVLPNPSEHPLESQANNFDQSAKKRKKKPLSTGILLIKST